MSNRTFLLSSVASLALLAAAGSAHAQEIDNSWTGAHIGASIGFGMSSTDTYNMIQDPITQLGRLGYESVVGGVSAGYDYEVSPGLVFGIEAGVEFFNGEGSITTLTVADDYDFRSFGAAYAGVRAGAEIAPRTLAYAGLSYAAIHAQTSEVVFDPQQTYLNGYRAAAGIETEVMDNVTLRVEGSYTQAIESLDINNDAREFTPSHLGATIGVSYRFGSESRGPRVALEPKRSWTGGYVGALAGGQGSSTENSFREFEQFSPNGPVSTIDPAYGAYMGFNVQMGDQWVISAEGEVTKFDAAYDYVLDDSQDFASSDYKGQVSVRLGYLVNPDTLIYARAGYGLMHMNPDPLFAAEGTESDYIQMFSAGMGVESMITENALLRIEGVYNSAIDEYRFLDSGSGNVYAAKPTSVEARVGAAFLF
jgi:outer membrane immunogenic protein